MQRAIWQRLRPICPDMPDDEFAALTRQMAEVEYKYQQGRMLPRRR